MPDRVIGQSDPFQLVLDETVPVTTSYGVTRIGPLASAAQVAAATGDALQKDQNLADLPNAATARTNLGGTTVGKAVFIAANAGAAQDAIGATATGKAVLIAANTGAAQDAIGATAIGKTVLTSANAAAVRNAVGANQKSMDGHFTTLVGGTAQTRWLAWSGGSTGFLISLTVILEGALTTGDATISVEVDGVATTPASLTLTQAASAAGSRFTMNFSAGNATIAASKIKLTVGGTNDAAVGAGFSIGAIY